MWGEIRYARPWDVRGHEPDGEHPNLVVGWRQFGPDRMTLIVPLTTPRSDHENWWEVNLSDADSCALVSGIRTIRVADLRRRRNTVGYDDMDQVVYTLRLLLTREDGMLPPSYPRGAVYEELIAGIGAVPRRSVVLRHNEGNGIALAMAIGNGDRLPDDSPVTIESSPELRGQCLLHGFVRPMAAAERLGSFVSQLDNGEVGAAVAKLLSLTYPGV